MEHNRTLTVIWQASNIALRQKGYVTSKDVRFESSRIFIHVQIAIVVDGPIFC